MKQVGGASAPRVIGVASARDKPEAGRLAKVIVAWLRDHGIEALDDADLDRRRGADRIDEQIDVIVTLGGDGMMLVAARAWPGVPLLGMNFGHLGFLTAVEGEQWQLAVERLLAGSDHYRLREESSLDIVVYRDDQPIESGWAANDVVVRAVDGIVDVELYIDNRFVNIYPGDGIIVSTVIGSTAYNLAAGGPVLASGVRGFAITPMLCASPIRLPLVVAEDAQIDLICPRAPGKYHVIMDGRHGERLVGGEEIKIRRSDKVCRLIIFPEMNLFDRMASKLNHQSRPGWRPARNVANGVE